MMQHVLRALSPAVPRPAPFEMFRAGLGAVIGLVLAELIGRAVGLTGTALIAPLGATGFLIFAVPNSPLAQPWSALLGNAVSALAALALLPSGWPIGVQAPLAVGLAVVAMAACRAQHPPGGAVALLAALSQPQEPGLYLVTVILGTGVLVVMGTLWNQATGRVYPFRHPAPSPHGTADPLPERRHLPPPGALADLLARLRLGANIGVEDLARLITAVEIEATMRPLAGLTARSLMSQDLITVSPSTALPDLARSFVEHRFKTLPVVDGDTYLGLVEEHALTGRNDAEITAADLLVHVPTATPETPAAQLVELLHDGGQQAVPVLVYHRLVGLVTRSDMIALLARPLAEAPPA